LTPQPISAVLSIVSQPPETQGAQIFLNQQLQPKTSPAVLSVLVGEYDVTLKHPKFLDASQKVTLSEGEQKKLIFEMQTYAGSRLAKRKTWNRRKWLNFTAGVVCLGAGYYCNLKGDEYYQDYQNATTNSLADATWKNTQTFYNYRDVSYSVSVVPMVFGVYSWIKQTSYRD